MPLSIRKTLSNFLSYKPRNNLKIIAIFQELIFLDREQGEALTRLVFDAPYQFIFVDVNTNQLYKNFDCIIVKDDHAGKKGKKVKTKPRSRKSNRKSKMRVVQNAKIIVSGAGGGAGGGG